MKFKRIFRLKMTLRRKRFVLCATVFVSLTSVFAWLNHQLTMPFGTEDFYAVLNDSTYNLTTRNEIK